MMKNNSWQTKPKSYHEGNVKCRLRIHGAEVKIRDKTANMNSPYRNNGGVECKFLIGVGFFDMDKITSFSPNFFALSPIVFSLPSYHEHI